MSGTERKPLSDAQIREAIATLPLWEVVDGKLHRVFQFDDFVDAFGFMTKLALVAERLDHHPEWSNTYATVEIFLSTHVVGAISSLDIELARRADALAEQRLGVDPS